MPWVRRAGFGVRLRQAMEELGLTFLKLGQFLALRFDLLPSEVCRELNQLFENVTPMPFGVATEVVESELGAPISELYEAFDPKPLAAASVAQVHVAYLSSGQRVAVKVQRLGLRRIFGADIRNLRRLATLIDAAGLFGKLSAKGMLNEFAQWTLRELDFTIEGRTAERLGAASKDGVIIPKIYWPLTTERVLTMEFVEGISVAETAKVLQQGGLDALQNRLPGFDLQRSLKVLADACLSQLFADGFFHGDPHPGNILLRGDNRVAFLDFGIFGSLSAYEKAAVAGQIENLATGNLEASFRYYAKQLIATEDSDFDRVREEAIEVLRRWYTISLDPAAALEEKHLARYTVEMIEVSRRNQLRFGLNYLLFWRALNHLNASLWLIAPDFDLMGELRDFFQRMRPSMIRHLTELVGDRERQADLLASSRVFPDAVAQSLGWIGEGHFTMRATITEALPLHRKRTLQDAGVAAALAVFNMIVLLGNPRVWPLAAAPALLLTAAAGFSIRRQK
jgi:ubiquinone biosynthesis protein